MPNDNVFVYKDIKLIILRSLKLSLRFLLGDEIENLNFGVIEDETKIKTVSHQESKQSVAFSFFI